MYKIKTYGSDYEHDRTFVQWLSDVIIIDDLELVQVLDFMNIGGYISQATCLFKKK